MTNSVYNLSKNNKLLDNVKIADSFFTRLKGLLGVRGLNAGEGIVIKPCNSIHTFGMKFSIDVAFVDKDNKVVHIMNSVPKGKMSPIIKGAKYVIEAGAGEFISKGLEVGNLLELRSNR